MWVVGAVVLALVVSGTVIGTALIVTSDDGEGASTPAADRGARTSSDVPATTAPTPTSEQTEETPAGFAETYEEVESGVLRILATTCEGDGIGTGFLLDPRTVATAAHVVDGASAVAVDAPTGPEPARVVGIDPVTDLALLRLSAPVAGHAFSFADDNPTPGTSVAAIGFPLDEPKTLTIGVVSGLDRTIRIEGESQSGLLQTDTAINPGNSGGPLVTSTGEVVGVVDAIRLHSQGIGYAVQVSVAEPMLAGTATMVGPTGPSCGETQAPDELVVDPRLLPLPDAVSSSVQQTLGVYYNAINAGDYDTVIEQFTPSYRGGFDVDEMARTLATSFDFSVVIREVSGSSSEAEAWVTFVSVQAPRFGAEGEACTEWSLDYLFADVGGVLLIDGVAPHDGDGHSAC